MEKVKFKGSYIEYFNRNKKCFWCESHFEPADKGQFLCSDKCRNAFREGKEEILNDFVSRGALPQDITLELVLDRMMEIHAKQNANYLIK